jgi:arylsulfatase A-like enzyme
MGRRWGFAALVCSAVAVGVLPGDLGADDPAPPNVLVVVLDDQRFDQLVAMPDTTRWFADGGTTFTSAFAETPLCCPSRASILTGRYTHNHGVVANRAEDVAALDLRTILPARLRRAGYQTAMAGKLFNTWAPGRPPPGFDRWALFEHGYRDAPFDVDGVVQTATGYSTDFIAGQALRMLDAFEQDDDRPWFLYLAPFAPHFPHLPAPADAGTAVPPLPDLPSMSEDDRSDKPPWLQGPPRFDRPLLELVWEDQLRTLLAVDRMVGAVAERLDALGERDVLAVYVSDNGFLLGEHGVTLDKRMPYEASIRVPLLLRWPGHVPAGAVDDRLVLNADIAPTILAAAGIGPEPGAPSLDGRSLLGADERELVYLEHYANQAGDGDPGVSSWVSIRRRDRQYVEWYRAGEVVFRELYDLHADPYQLENLLAPGRPEAAEVAADAAELRRLQRCHGTTGDAACP